MKGSVYGRSQVWGRFTAVWPLGWRYASEDGWIFLGVGMRIGGGCPAGRGSFTKWGHWTGGKAVKKKCFLLIVSCAREELWGFLQTSGWALNDPSSPLSHKDATWLDERCPTLGWPLARLTKGSAVDCFPTDTRLVYIFLTSSSLSGPYWKTN